MEENNKINIAVKLNQELLTHGWGLVWMFVYAH